MAAQLNSPNEQNTDESAQRLRISKSAKTAAPDRLSGLLDHFVETTAGHDNVTIGDLLDSLDSRSHGPMLLFPAIIAISPIGMLPFVSHVTGSLIILIAGQMMLFSSRPWIPRRLSDFQIPREKFTHGVNKTKPWVVKFEKVVRHRFDLLASGLMVYPIAIVSILLALSFFPLTFVPFGVFVPGLAIALYGLGLTARDGIVVMLGFLFTAVSVWLLVKAWPW